MENPKPLATESFSYSWLVDIKPHSSRKPSDRDQNFDFDVPSCAPFVHADELFADGRIVPVCVERFENLSASLPPSPVCHFGGYFAAAAGGGSSSKVRASSIGRWRKSSGRLWRKCFGLVRPLLCRWPRKSVRVDDLDRKVWEVRSWGNSVQASPGSVGRKCGRSEFSPRISPARSSSSWCGDESSIHEAILYCKRSIEK